MKLRLFKWIKQKIKHWFLLDNGLESITQRLDNESRQYLLQQVSFYKNLSESDREVFEKRILLFLKTTKVLGNGVEVEQADRLLVSSGAIIPVWKFVDWHYFNLQEVILVPGSFNEASQFGKQDSRIQGMVGTGPMSGKMILSKPALHYGFSNNRDKRNVAIHEFSHLIDMADGACDGFPERLSEYAFCVPWFDLMYQKMDQIDNRQSNIDAYGATDKVEFFSVATEYFFERPGMLKKKHPQVYQALKGFYQQDVSDIQHAIKPRKKDPCPCGSGKRYKHCCISSK